MPLHQDKVWRRGFRDCGLCKRKLEINEPVVRFIFSKFGVTGRENLCIKCMEDIVNEDKKR